ncbi:MAG: ABC transporter permease subunit [Desulfomonile tiedjei]|nr:ABC transporter permease subunit [Desulfomonile tiedjei]
MANTAGAGPKQTRRWVLIVDRIADRTITIGGVLVIAAVLLMMVFLVYEVTPLFRGGSLESASNYAFEGKPKETLGLSMDDYRTVAVGITRDGTILAWHARTGTALKAPSFDFGGKTVTAFAQTLDTTNAAFGFSDGSVRFGRIIFKNDLLPADPAPPDLKPLDSQDSTDGSAVFSVIPGKQIRKISVEVQLDEQVVVSETGSPIVALNYRLTDFGERPKRTFVALDSQGVASLNIAESKLNLFTRKVKTDVTKTILPALPAGAVVSQISVTEAGDQVYFAEKSGRIYRFATRDLNHPELVDTQDVLPTGVGLTALGFLVGDVSLVVGGSDGSLSIYFLLEKKGASSSDGLSLVQTRKLEPQIAAVTGFAAEARGKTFATADARGGVWVRHGTSQRTLLRLTAQQGVAPHGLVLAPRLNGLLLLGQGGQVNFWDIDIPHPEVSLHTLFGKVWYEGYPQPTYTWQSSAATDAFEPKLSLVPLIFGTLKGTFYSLLFAVPVALLAAIYTSEFLPQSARGKVKPVMEVMASIPSVVLGFVAALVLAPFVENWIGSVMLVFAIVPLSLVLAAYLWQLLPPSLALRLHGLTKFLLMFVVVGAALWLAYQAGPLFEKVFFNGNFQAWLNRDTGRPAPFLFILILPLMAVAVSLAASRVFGQRFSLYLRNFPPLYSAILDLLRWMALAAVIGGLSYILALFLEAMGVDPRGEVVSTYVQRNTFIVGFAMGFAVIPIIYTLAEDALNAVPDHLRAASLGCGATPWQTAMWIILPTAMSGVFSAIMIGMGRAVGETMIVVMSAGNTPLIDLNIFNGLRALSANIAVELPEAPKDGTLYRVLFLTGLVLFGMTFVINTVAELVRLRFRKRAMQL